MVFAMYMINQLKDSRIGRAWEAIREDEVAAAAMGIPVVKMKLYAFAIGASTSGLAGWTLATKVGFINPNTFPLLSSILVLCAVVIGGIGSSAGAIVGAAIVFGVPELLRSVQIETILGFDVLTGRIAIFGLLLVIMMIFRPGGLITSSRRQAELGGGHGDIAEDTSGMKSVDA
jgi:branched-chain amino acid transport system permease protein